MSMDFQRQMPGSKNSAESHWLYKLHLDPLLLVLVVAVLAFGLMVLFSAGDQSRLFDAQLAVLVAMAVLVVAAQLPPGLYFRWAPFVYFLGLFCCYWCLVGVKVKGSQRWLEIPGLLRFQPSELMKIAVPMALAWHLQQRVLPPSAKHVFFRFDHFIARVSDSGATRFRYAILVAGAGMAVLMLAGLSWRYLGYAFF